MSFDCLINHNYFNKFPIICSHSGQNSIAELQQKLSQLTTQQTSQVAPQEVVNQVSYAKYFNTFSVF